MKHLHGEILAVKQIEGCWKFQREPSRCACIGPEDNWQARLSQRERRNRLFKLAGGLGLLAGIGFTEAAGTLARSCKKADYSLRTIDVIGSWIFS